MKKFILCEIGIIAAAFLTFGFSDDLGTILFILAIVFPIASLIKAFGKDAKKIAGKSKTNETETKAEEPARPRTIQEYLWLMDTEDIGNKFVRAYKEDLEETDDYHMTKKEILDEYYYGDKIYKYEPFSLPFKVEDRKVFSQLEDGEWTFVGNIKKRDIEKYEKSIRTELYLMPNYFKKVIDEETVETDSGDSYFGLEVTIEM